MSITKRYRTSFDMKVVVPTEFVEQFTQELIEGAKDFMKDPSSLSPLQVHILKKSLTDGVEAAIEEMHRAMTKDAIKELLDGMVTSYGNISMKVLK